MELAWKASEPARQTLEPAGRAQEPAGRESELARRALEPVRRALEPAGSPWGRKETDSQRELWNCQGGILALGMIG